MGFISPRCVWLLFHPFGNTLTHFPLHQVNQIVAMAIGTEIRVPTTQEELDKLFKENHETPIVVKFSATWCKPCEMIAPHFSKLAKQHKNVLCLSVDVDDFSDWTYQCNVTAMPTFMVFYRGNPLHASTIRGANVDRLNDLFAFIGKDVWQNVPSPPRFT